MEDGDLSYSAVLLPKTMATERQIQANRQATVDRFSPFPQLQWYVLPPLMLPHDHAAVELLRQADNSSLLCFRFRSDGRRQKIG
jgi:hypothetical protein